MMFIAAGFVFGFLIPYMARRFAKFMPATPGYALYRIFSPGARVSVNIWKNNERFVSLLRKFLMRSLGWAILTAMITAAFEAVFGSANIGWFLFLSWILLLLYEVDERMFLLPDMLTVPLLLGGFCFAAFAPEGVFGAPTIIDSALGAVLGYALPIAASLFMVKKYPEAFGGGDIKLFSACGAWLGFEMVPVLILFSSVVFGAFCLFRRQRAGAFGPAIVIATLGLVFFGKSFMMLL